MKLFLLLFTLFSLGFSLFLWEPRSLKCEKEQCFLEKNQKNEWKNATCHMENEKKICDIECDGAERDSVISKNPTDFRYCNRFFTYNTRKSEDGEWLIWRNGTCAQANITMTVHCAFPVNGQR